MVTSTQYDAPEFPTRVIKEPDDIFKCLSVTTVSVSTGFKFEQWASIFSSKKNFIQKSHKELFSQNSRLAWDIQQQHTTIRTLY